MCATPAGSLQALGLGLPPVGEQMSFVLLEAPGLFLRTAVCQVGAALRLPGLPLEPLLGQVELLLISPSFSSFYLSVLALE